ncbi:TKL family protein kinase [Histomonas meleagridis]|uniref:TKL family protein kinase n=1 Tax=Histomonas meleagridis TaxID=135588 RepID=UPI00355A5E44|nr:TKL family protein kinase [Histomonas meleagridis]KAH0799612.1 TKL family protein kinase [Histomonas meleagridis]
MMQKISHPMVLKILEIGYIENTLGFASEHIVSNITSIGKISRDEGLYLVQSISNVMKDLHSMKIAYLGLTPQNIFINHRFSVKLGPFIHATTFQYENETLQHPFTPWVPNSIFHLPSEFLPPEIIMGRGFTAKADVYMFALTCLFIFQKKDSKGPLSINSCDNLPEGFDKLLKNCMLANDNARLTFGEIVNSHAFTSLVCSVFNYIYDIGQHDVDDLLNFFVGLRDIIYAFSFRMIQSKFMPIFMFYINNNIELCSVLLSIIFAVQDKYKKDSQFNEEIIKPLTSIFQIKGHPKICETLIRYMAVLLKRVSPIYYDSTIIPTILNSLDTTDESVSISCVKVLPYVIPKMTNIFISDKLTPALSHRLASASSQELAKLIMCVFVLISKRLGSDFTIKSIIPSLSDFWNLRHWSQAMDPAIDLLQLLDIEISQKLISVVPFALSMLSSDTISRSMRARLLFIIHSILDDYQESENVTSEELVEAQIHALPNYEFPTQPLPNPLEEEEDEYEIYSDSDEEVPEEIEYQGNSRRRSINPFTMSQDMNIDENIELLNFGQIDETEDINENTKAKSAMNSLVDLNFEFEDDTKEKISSIRRSRMNNVTIRSTRARTQRDAETSRNYRGGNLDIQQKTKSLDKLTPLR